MDQMRWMKWGVLTVGISLLLSLGYPGSRVHAEELTDAQTDGFLQWHYSLEQTIKAREEAETPEGNLLFPFDLPGWEDTEPKPYRHLAISRAIMDLEAQWLLRGGNKEASALVALAHARNYTNLSEYDSAMVWYQAAARLDTLGLFRREIGVERLATTMAAGDSLGMAQLITNTLGASDLSGREKEVVLAYRWLLTDRDSESLGILMGKMEGNPALLEGEVLFWHAYGQAWMDKTGKALGNLLTMVEKGGLSQGLTEKQRTWVLMAIPDLLFLRDNTTQARPLYEVLRESSLDELRIWSLYQVANLDFLATDFGKAANGYDLVCSAHRLGTWQDQACEMATMARELERIKNEGEAYGAAQFYQP